MTWSCRIPGPPVAQARPRIVKKGPHSGLADTPEVADYKSYARLTIAQTKPPVLMDGPLSMTVEILLPKPPSWPKRRIHADTKPDADNFCKLVCDVCEGLVYTNDSRIVDLHIRKLLAPVPEVRIQVIELNSAAELPLDITDTKKSDPKRRVMR